MDLSTTTVHYRSSQLQTFNRECLHERDRLQHCAVIVLSVNMGAKIEQTIEGLVAENVTYPRHRHRSRRVWIGQIVALHIVGFDVRIDEVQVLGRHQITSSLATTGRSAMRDTPARRPPRKGVIDGSKTKMATSPICSMTPDYAEPCTRTLLAPVSIRFLPIADSVDGDPTRVGRSRQGKLPTT